MIYADSSALARAYLTDEADQADLYAHLLAGDELVITSELTLVELAAAVRGASRAGRLRRWRAVLDAIERDFGSRGPVTAISLDAPVILPAARSLVLEHRLKTLDSIHLSVALEERRRAMAEDDLVFVTRDGEQAAAARALGMATA